MHETTLYVDATVVHETNRILERKSKLDDTKEDLVIETFTGTFPNQCQADIKVCNGNPPYIDPVLFDENGIEISLLEPDDGPVQGDWEWTVPTDTDKGVKDEKYTLHLRARYYCCGGMYQPEDDPQRERLHLPNRNPAEFKFVCPTRGLPYVRLDEKGGRDLFHLCQHHSHLYWFDDTMEFANLLEESFEARRVPSPKQVKLTDEHKQQLKAAIEKEITE